jgi:hypothetical protein
MLGHAHSALLRLMTRLMAASDDEQLRARMSA